MRASFIKKGTQIKVSGIYNESMLDDVYMYCKKSGCSFETQNYCTEAIVSGTKEQLEKFVKLWNK